MTSKILIKGGRVIGGPSEPSDLLIEDGVIGAIGVGLDVSDAEIVDAKGMLVAPGFVDTHRHLWQTSIRGVAADWSLVEYIRFIRLGYATAYRPEDVWISNYVGALEALDAGITTICDFCHIVRTPDHADAAIEALDAAGIRGQLYYGFYDVPTEPPYFRDHQARIDDAKAFFERHFVRRGAGALVSMGVALTEFGLVSIGRTAAEIGVARDLDVPMTMHMGTLSTPDGVSRLRRAGLLGPRMLHVHCNASSDDELRMIGDSGGTISITPETELQMGMGYPITNRALNLGLKPTLGIDIVSDYSGDMFAQMRIALQTGRAIDNQKILDAGRMPSKINLTVLDAYQFATSNGAEAIGLGRHIGSLEPGKRADILLIRQDGIHHAPRAADPIASIVLHARPSDIDSVFVSGVARKRHGKLIGVDLPAGDRPRTGVGRPSRGRVRHGNGSNGGDRDQFHLCVANRARDQRLAQEQGMKLASLKHGRDGRLVVVSRDLERAADAAAIASTLQMALDDWRGLEPRLRLLSRALEGRRGAVLSLQASRLRRPTAARLSMDRRIGVCESRGAGSQSARRRAADVVLDRPLMYQGGSDGFLGPRDDIELMDEAWGADFEGGAGRRHRRRPHGLRSGAAARRHSSRHAG